MCFSSGGMVQLQGEGVSPCCPLHMLVGGNLPVLPNLLPASFPPHPLILLGGGSVGCCHVGLFPPLPGQHVALPPGTCVYPPHIHHPCADTGGPAAATPPSPWLACGPGAVDPTLPPAAHADSAAVCPMAGWCPTISA